MVIQTTSNIRRIVQIHRDVQAVEHELNITGQLVVLPDGILDMLAFIYQEEWLIDYSISFLRFVKEVVTLGAEATFANYGILELLPEDW